MIARESAKLDLEPMIERCADAASRGPALFAEEHGFSESQLPGALVDLRRTSSLLAEPRRRKKPLSLLSRATLSGHRGYSTRRTAWPSTRAGAL
mmetsp:Transcript_3021/g.9174  ORF Transcript_3021/g.9174 Transcript_3021/m.9174 type:complete len:94 (-) Transcript_3021:489-770(-)